MDVVDILWPPDRLQKLPMCKHLACMAHQLFQQPIFRAGQHNWHTIQLDLMGGIIEQGVGQASLSYKPEDSRSISCKQVVSEEVE